VTVSRRSALGKRKGEEEERERGGAGSVGLGCERFLLHAPAMFSIALRTLCDTAGKKEKKKKRKGGGRPVISVCAIPRKWSLPQREKKEKKGKREGGGGGGGAYPVLLTVVRRWSFCT